MVHADDVTDWTMDRRGLRDHCPKGRRLRECRPDPGLQTPSPILDSTTHPHLPQAWQVKQASFLAKALASHSQQNEPGLISTKEQKQPEEVSPQNPQQKWCSPPPLQAVAVRRESVREKGGGWAFCTERAPWALEAPSPMEGRVRMTILACILTFIQCTEIPLNVFKSHSSVATLPLPEGRCRAP